MDTFINNSHGFSKKLFFKFVSTITLIYIHYIPFGICILYKENICNGDVFSPECSSDSVILMKKAKYGRMSEGVCGTINLGYLGCSENVLNVVDSECSAQKSCSLIIGDEDKFRIEPCPQLKSYLEVEYDCQKVVTSGLSNCRICEGIEITAPTGYLSSEMTSKTSCGSSICPWILKADEGQIIEFTLYDFSDKSLKSPATKCQLYSVIMEFDDQRSTQVCGTTARESKVHVSQSHRIQIYLVHDNRSPFLIHYIFIGCKDIYNENMIFHREGDRAKIKCKHSNEEYGIECVDEEWKGFEETTCTEHKRSNKRDFSSVSWDLWAILISSVCFMLGCFIIVFGLWSFCRDKSWCDNQFPIKVNEDIYNEPMPVKEYKGKYQEPYHMDRVFTHNQAFKDFPSDYNH